MNASDQIANRLTGQAVNLLRLAEGIRKTVLADLEELEAELVRDLAVAVGKGVTPFTLARLKTLLRQTRDSISSAYEGIDADTQEAALRIARAVAVQTAAAVNAVVGADLISVAVSENKLAAIASDVLLFGKIQADWWLAQSERLQEAFTREMRMGQMRGETLGQLVARVRGTKAGGWADGIMQASRSQAEALVRTSTMAVAGEANQRLYAANRDVVKGVQWVSTLDSRTTEICIALDGKQWRFPEEGDAYADFIPVGHDKEFSPPPAHWNCRSTIVPVTFSWEELAGRHGNSAAAQAADDVPEGTRASMDGQVAASTTFEDWLQTQSEEFQNEVLGPRRAEMWRTGRIELSQLTDVRNNPLTLEQLEEIAGVK